MINVNRDIVQTGKVRCCKLFDDAEVFKGRVASRDDYVSLKCAVSDYVKGLTCEAG